MTTKNNAFKILMEAAAHHKDTGTSPVKRKAAGNPHHWSAALKKAKNDPELMVHENEKYTVIKDKYPKAKFHFLIIPEVDVSLPSELKSEHLDLLREMRKEAEMLAEKHKDLKFRFGFHAKPSMAHLHMHVISQDFVSDCLKTKKHWNSFNTKHFIDCSDLITQLEQNGKVILPTAEEIESYLREPLICNQCSFEAKTMPLLKNHLLKHLNK